MRLPVQKRSFGLTFNITPLIDIVFLLIIFFLVASHFVRSETHDEVALPDAIGGRDDESASLHRMTITVNADSRLSVNSRSVDLAELKAMLTKLSSQPDAVPEVRIRGDKTVEWKVVEPIILECARLGISNVKTAVVTPQ